MFLHGGLITRRTIYPQLSLPIPEANSLQAISAEIPWVTNVEPVSFLRNTAQSLFQGMLINLLHLRAVLRRRLDQLASSLASDDCRHLLCSAPLSLAISRLAAAFPEFVLLIWVNNVMPVALSAIVGERIRFNPILSATIALGVVASGYFAETFRAGIQAVPRGHVEAARALGDDDALKSSGASSCHRRSGSCCPS